MSELGNILIKNNIFISHAGEDIEILVEPFVRCLEQKGIIYCWYARTNTDRRCDCKKN
jgi:hypothetical protein